MITCNILSLSRLYPHYQRISLLFVPLLLCFSSVCFAQSPQSSGYASNNTNVYLDSSTYSEKQADGNATAYEFHPGDGIELAADPDTGSFISGVYPIDENGYSDLPMLGPVKIAGRSRIDIENYLRESYINYLPFAKLQARPMMRLSMLGGFFRPGLYYVHPSTSLWEAIQLTGGTQREDGLRKLRWRRNNNVVSSNLVPSIESGKSIQTLGFHSGDQITVPTIRQFYLADILTQTLGVSISIIALIIAATN